MTTIPWAATPPRRRRGPLAVGWLPLVPATTALALFFAVPMGMMIGISFRAADVPGFTADSYRHVFGDRLVLAGVLRTVVMSALVAVAVTVMAWPVAWFLARSRSRWRGVVFALAIAPELAGVVLRTYGWLIILESRGFINDLLISLGVTAEPLPLAKNMFGVVVGLTHVLLPFGILSLLTSIQGIDPSLEKAARILGASRLSVLRHIVLPLAVPGIVSSLFIAFTLAASAYATPALLGGSGFNVLATMIYQQILFFVNWPLAAAMANVLLIIVLGAAFAGARIESRLHRKISGR